MRGLLPCAMLASAARAFVRSARHPAPVARAAVRAMSQKSDSYEMEGTITKIGENQEFESGFNKVEFVITTDSMFPQEIKFDLNKEKINLIDGFSEKQKVKVFFNIRGNEWQGRHFINLQCWRLEEAAGGGGDFYYEPPAAAAAEGEVASSSSASSAGGAFDAPFAAYSDDAPAAPTEPKKDGDIPF